MSARIQIESVEEVPLREVLYLNASTRGGTEVSRLPIVRAAVGPLAGELDAIIACSDLQGIAAARGGAATLLGIEVAAVLEELAEDGTLPPAARTGVILAGDLYSVPEANRRGGYGDVAEVWWAFVERFAWVVGVAGNHDDVSSVASLGDRIHLLDGDVIAVDGIRIGGVGGIAGTKQKPGRRPEATQLALLDQAIAGRPDVMVLHEGPHGAWDQLGSAAIRTIVEGSGVGLTICGHEHWDQPLGEHAKGQILNVDTRVVVMTAPRR